MVFQNTGYVFREELRFINLCKVAILTAYCHSVLENGAGTAAFGIECVIKMISWLPSGQNVVLVHNRA